MPRSVETQILSAFLGLITDGYFLGFLTMLNNQKNSKTFMCNCFICVGSVLSFENGVIQNFLLRLTRTMVNDNFADLLGE